MLGTDSDVKFNEAFASLSVLAAEGVHTCFIVHLHVLPTPNFITSGVLKTSCHCQANWEKFGNKILLLASDSDETFSKHLFL